MKKIFCIILLTFPLFSLAQSGLKQIKTNSWQTFVYRINALDAEQFMKWDSIPVSRFVDQEPMLTLRTDSVEEAKLPAGNYVLLSVRDHHIHAEMKSISGLILLTINNKQQLQLDVRDKDGEFKTSLKVYVNDRAARFNPDSRTFWVRQRNPDEAMVKVYAPNDTLYRLITILDEPRSNISQQRRRNYRFTKIYKLLNWFPHHAKQLLRQKNGMNHIGASGYLIFNQPKYKPLDTVKFKAYIVNRKWKQYKKEVEVYVSYYNKGKNCNQFLQTLKPLSAGAYVGQFSLADTLPIDIKYNIFLKTKKGKIIIRNDFKIEDYVLDEMGTYSFKSLKDSYVKNDTLLFIATARDANGLNVMDATATLYLITTNINKIYQDTLFVPDTLYKQQIKFSTNNDTRFSIPTNILPQANLSINARLVIRNANNELHEERANVEYHFVSKELVAKQYDDSLKVFYSLNGIKTEAAGEMEIDEGESIPVHYPLCIKIDPLAREYDFTLYDGDEEVYEFVEIRTYYRPQFSRISLKDTLGFTLHNPYKIPVYYTVFNGKRVVAAGKESGEAITWKKVMKDRRQSYKVCWQYMWAGTENYADETIGLLYKILNIKVKATGSVYPGQKDSVKIHIEDYKGKPAQKVNLTSVSYNNQFNKVVVKDPPYLAKYKGGHFLERATFQNDEEMGVKKKYLLGINQAWVDKFHLDTMVYYKMLFPATKYYDAVTSIESFIPQLSVNVVDNGVPQQIYLLYINRQLVYYNGVTDHGEYAFQAYPGMAQITIRTLDRYIELDSIYIQPNYKHDLSFDLNDLPMPHRIISTEKYWSNAEINQLENSMWQMKNNPLNNRAYVWQDSKVVRLANDVDHVVGPFRKAEMQFFNPGHFDIHFNFEAGYQYDLSRQIARLERKPLFTRKDEKNWLPYFKNTFLKYGDTMLPAPGISYAQNGRTIFLTQNPNAKDYWYGSRIAVTGVLQFDYLKDSTLQYIIVHEQDSNTSLVLVPERADKIINLPAGNYSFLLVTNNLLTSSINNLVVKANGILFVDMRKMPFTDHDTLLEKNFEASPTKLK